MGVIDQTGPFYPAIDPTSSDCDTVCSKCKIDMILNTSHESIIRVLMIDKIPPVDVGNVLRPL